MNFCGAKCRASRIVIKTCNLGVSRVLKPFLEFVKRANVYVALVEVNRREDHGHEKCSHDPASRSRFRSRYRDYFRRNVD